MKKIIKDIKSIPNDDQHVIGLADLNGLLVGPYKEYRYGLIIARKLNDDVINLLSKGPNLEYYKLYNETNDYLSNLAIRISDELKALNIDSLVIKPTMTDQELSDDYKKNLRTEFSHKMAGTRAGIGWIGKTDLLVTKKFGPRVRLATVLTKIPIGECATPISKSRCGECNECVEKCPAKAASGLSWDVSIDRNEFYNPFKCREFCKMVSKKNIDKDISLCGICVSACPIGQKKGE